MSTLNDIMHTEFMAFAQDDLSLAALAEWAERQGWPSACVQTGGLYLLLRLLEQAPTPKLVFVDLDATESGASPDIAMRLSELTGKLDKDQRVIAFGTINDIGFYRHVVEAGAADYLVKPLTMESLNQALAAAQRSEQGTAGQKKNCKTILMLGARSGIGTSTLAVNLAWQFADKHHMKTVLLDLDLHFGISSLALDLQPGRGLRDILGSPHRVDSLMIASAMTNVNPRLSLLASEEPLDDPAEIDTAAVAALLKELRGQFGVVLVDMPRDLLIDHKRLVTHADTIVIVTEMSLAGIRDALRLKTLVKSLDPPAPILFVGSRTATTSSGQIDRESFEKGVQDSLSCIVPEDVKSATLAANSGKAMIAIAPTAPASQAIVAFAKTLSGEADHAPTLSAWWQRLWQPVKDESAQAVKAGA